MIYLKTYKLFENVYKPYLDMSRKHLKNIEEIPENILEFDCSYNDLVSLPTLPKNLKVLDCYQNLIYELLDLPDSLEEISASNNQLREILKLPKSLIRLECDHNNLTYFPELPSNLEGLLCDCNQLRYLPDLPESLTTLVCWDNNWDEPIKKEIIDKFDLHETYTKEQIKRFSGENFQRIFLKKNDERFQDLNCDGLTIHPIIRKEFAYLFEGSDMGFFDLKTK